MNQVAKLDLAQIRQQAINDGLLVDQSSIGKQAGFLTNVAVTPAIVDGVFGADGKHSVEDFLFMFCSFVLLKQRSLLPTTRIGERFVFITPCPL